MNRSFYNSSPSSSGCWYKGSRCGSSRSTPSPADWRWVLPRDHTNPPHKSHYCLDSSSPAIRLSPLRANYVQTLSLHNVPPCLSWSQRHTPAGNPSGKGSTSAAAPCPLSMLPQPAAQGEVLAPSPRLAHAAAEAGTPGKTAAQARLTLGQGQIWMPSIATTLFPLFPTPTPFPLSPSSSIPRLWLSTAFISRNMHACNRDFLAWAALQLPFKMDKPTHVSKGMEDREGNTASCRRHLSQESKIPVWGQLTY